MSGGEPSSIKRCTRCAVSQPALSDRYVCRVNAIFEVEVYGLILQLVFFGKGAESCIRRCIVNGDPKALTTYADKSILLLF